MNWRKAGQGIVISVDCPATYIQLLEGTYTEFFCPPAPPRNNPNVNSTQLGFDGGQVNYPGIRAAGGIMLADFPGPPIPPDGKGWTVAGNLLEKVIFDYHFYTLVYCYDSLVEVVEWWSYVEVTWDCQLNKLRDVRPGSKNPRKVGIAGLPPAAIGLFAGAGINPMTGK